MKNVLKYSKINKLVSSIKDDFIVDFIESSINDKGNGEIEIRYSFNLEYADRALGYTLDDCFANFPEEHELKGYIEIDVENWIIQSKHSDSSIDGNSFDGYQFDFENNTKEIIDYLEIFNSNLAGDPDYTTPETVELINYTDLPHNDYHATHVSVIRKNDTVYVKEYTNHQGQLFDDVDYMKIEDWNKKISENTGQKYSFVENWENHIENLREIIK